MSDEIYLDDAALRAEILRLTREHARRQVARSDHFEPGSTLVNYAGRVYDADDVERLVGASLDFWLTAGPEATTLENRLARWIGVEHLALVNSGSSANLLAFATLMSHRLGDRRIEPGDEVITVAAGFPTTVAPIVQLGAVPVFVDVKAETANIDTTMLEAARSDRTKAVMVAHALGNPFDLDAVMDFCRRHDLWLVEDNCDALGSRWDSAVEGEQRYTGTFGHLATSSFYPAHHMTTGEGGAVYTSDDELAGIMLSIRDWGRDCWCKSGRDNTCGKRFDQQHGSLPFGYDHKFVYSHLGFNLKMTDLQAAVGVAQLEKLDAFCDARRRNHDRLRAGIADLAEVLRPVSATPRSDPAWFGFLMTVAPDAPFDRNELVAALEGAKIQTRNLFAGNLLRHPAFDPLVEGRDYRVVGELTTTDLLMGRALWIGVHPGLDERRLGYMLDVIHNSIATLSGRRSVRASNTPVGIRVR